MSPSELSPIERSVENLTSVLRSFLPGGTTRALHCGPVDLLIAILALVLVGGLSYAVALSPQPLGFLEFLALGGSLLAGVLAVALVTVMVRQAKALSQVIIGLLWAMLLGAVLALVVSIFASAETPLEWLVTFGAPFLLPPILFLVTALGPIGGVSAGLTLAGAIAIIALAPPSHQEDGKSAFELADTEALYEAQPALLERQINALRQGDPKRIELFAVLGAGYPYERVFQREVEAVSTQLTQRFEAEDRVLSLVNSAVNPLAYPLLNRGNLARALDATKAAMDDDDFLFLFLTSHGGTGFLATEFDGALTRDLTFSDVSTALDRSGIGNAVVIVSACFSGSFAEALARPDRLVLTAASADKSSFGCSDQAEWTNWGRAFFVEALADTRDPREAARIARDLVADWEVEQGYPSSDPLILEGADIGPVLDDWLATLPTR